MGRIAQETISGAKWGILQRCTMQPIQFVYGMILARLITPDEMGILGLTGIFFAVAEQLRSCGFGAALIRKQDRTQLDCSTVFWFNVVVSLILSAILFLAAPWFAEFFHQPPLVNLTRASAVLMFLNSTASVHWTLYSARRDFKTPAIVSMATTLVAMPVCIWTAYLGWSYWAVMMQGVVSGLLSLAVIWIVSPWKPSFAFSWASFREFFGYGSRLALTGIITTLYDESRTFVLGKFYSAGQLALYTRARHLCQMPISLVQGTLGNVTFPILATIQHDTARLDAVYRKYIRLTLMPILWLMITLAANSHSVIFVLYGETWAACSPYAKMLCLGVMFSPLTGINCSYISVRGRSDILLRREIIVRCVGFTLMILGALHSALGVCAAAALAGMVSAGFSVYYTSRISDLKIRQQLADFIPLVLLAGISNIPSCLLDWLRPLHPILCASIGVAVSFVAYFGYLLCRKDATLLLLWQYIRNSKVVKRLLRRQ